MTTFSQVLILCIYLYHLWLIYHARFIYVLLAFGKKNLLALRISYRMRAESIRCWTPGREIYLGLTSHPGQLSLAILL